MNKIKLKFDNGIYISHDITNYLKEFFELNKTNIDLAKNILEIEFDSVINIEVLYKSIKLYINDENILIAFDKYFSNIKEDLFTIDSICCEYCLRNLIEKLLINKNISSCKVISDDGEYTDVKLVISYKENVEKEKIINIINCINNNEN